MPLLKNAWDNQTRRGEGCLVFPLAESASGCLYSSPILPPLEMEMPGHHILPSRPVCKVCYLQFWVTFPIATQQSHLSFAIAPCHCFYCVDRRQVFLVKYTLNSENMRISSHVLRLCTVWKWSVDHTDSSEIKEKQEFGLGGVPYRHMVYDHK